MIPPDREIYEVEKRIAERRHRVERAARETGRQTLRALTSPWALAGAAVLGFLVAGGVGRRHQGPHVDRRKNTAAKAGGIASVALAVASWIIKSQFGSPAALARFALSKVQSNRQAPSPRSDRPLRNPSVTTHR